MSESFQDFATRHGGDSVVISGRYVFPDGAQSNGTHHIAPPSDPRAQIRLQIQFLNEKLLQADQAFEVSLKPMVERDFQFTKRQNCSRIYTGGRWLFQNGAQWTAVGGIESPEDAVEKLTLECEFLAAMLEREAKLFRQCKSYISVQSEYHKRGAGPLPPEDAFTELERFKSNVDELRKQLQSKQVELRNLRGPTPSERYHQKRDKQRAAGHEAIQRATAVQL